MTPERAALDAQLDYLEASSPFYRARIRGRRDLAELPFTTKQELRESQLNSPPFGEHLCAPREQLVRLHVTSGTTGDPVAIGLTHADHEANSKVGGEAFRIAGLQPTDTVAHCLNYALYAGGIADHMAIEASGATVVPVGIGQSRRLLDLIPRLGISAIFGTLSFPAYLATRAREQGLGPAALGLRHIVTAGEPGAGLAAIRSEIEAAWGANVTDTFGMSDVWSTMAGECGACDGLHLTTEGYAVLEGEFGVPGVRKILREALGAEVSLVALRTGDLPVAEHKTVRVFRTARGDALPDAVRRHREAP